MSLGSRIVHKEKPEYGFGFVRYEETDVLGEQRLHVVFEHLDHPLILAPDEVTNAGSVTADALNGMWGDVRLLVRRLACALVIAENNQTGGFLRTTVQPMPHQVALLDKVMSGNRLGHLFADDVGLGKTIEAGLLITATLCGKPNARIMVVCPAGLALQWQEELDEHFSHSFEILGVNLAADTLSNWQNHRLIIAPIDRIKQKRYLEIFRSIEAFDLVVCDEAHRLNAHRDLLTRKLTKTRNYELFESLVSSQAVQFIGEAGAPRSPKMIFLSATPHQGDDLRFYYLLHLLRPDLFPVKGDNIEPLTRERLQEVMTRTPKSEARDWEGHLLFKGHTVTTLDITWTVAETETSRGLTEYISRAVSGSQPGRELIVALVMHTFHKIAASSWSALGHTLRSRLNVLRGVEKGFASSLDLDDSEPEQELGSTDLDKAFYEGEKDALLGLIARVEALPADQKWLGCAELLLKLEKKEPGCRVLFFTQFKQTQRYLVDQIGRLFPGTGIEVINGDIALEERRAARRRFEGASRFMISTEAGGEGVNLQRACHIMVNYDWPWNPMRLQQRIGRLDRYGQQQTVHVFNLRVPDSWDQKIATRIEERLTVIQKTMGEVVSADIEDYREMILGEIADQIDPTKAFMAEVRHAPVDEAELDRKLKAAVASMQRWKERFGNHLKPAASDPKLRPTLGTEHLKAAYGAALEGKELKLRETRTSEQQFVSGVYHFELPAEFRDSRVRPNRSQYVAFDRERFNEVRNTPLGHARGQPITVGLAGFGENFTDWLFQSTLHAQGNAAAFSVRVPAGSTLEEGWLAIYCLRYLGAGRRFLAPDELVAINIKEAVTSWRIVPAVELFSAMSVFESESTNLRSEVPDLTALEAAAKQALKERVQQRGNQSRTPPGLTLWKLVRITKAAQLI